MRTAFLVLVLLNLGFFAWTRFASGEREAETSASRERQIEPERLPIVSAGAGLRSGSAPPDGVAGAAIAGELPTCVEWGGFALAEAARGRTALEPLALGGRLSERKSDETAGWWVFIPSQGNRPAAQKKATELKALGIEDHFIVEEDVRNRFALSLGIFSTIEGAQSRLAALRDKGVRTAQIGQRETPVQKLWYQVRTPVAAELSVLRDLAEKATGTELRNCASAPS